MRQGQGCGHRWRSRATRGTFQKRKELKGRSVSVERVVKMAVFRVSEKQDVVVRDHGRREGDLGSESGHNSGPDGRLEPKLGEDRELDVPCQMR